ncbi:HEAT repeat domain-containing protein [Actinocorallia aurantiaca]|uniref:HEAT repeat protein n=1 Tax=Actinocorallia aurantiaca TaxID=46204 RepID=A0ABN3UU92_9ACTN
MTGIVAWEDPVIPLDADPEDYAGSDLDVRAVLQRLPAEDRPGRRLDDLPWGRFHHAHGRADDVPGFITNLGSSDPMIAKNALRLLSGTLCHQGSTSAPGAMAVPFLLRVAENRIAHHRADVLWLIADIARRCHYGDGTRAGFLRTAPDGLTYDTYAYPAGWSIQAARDALAQDMDILIALLDDPDPEVRSHSAYALAAATVADGSVYPHLHGRLRAEQRPEVRASLVLAIAQLAFDRDRDHATAWAHSLLSNLEQPDETRVSAAIAWLCLTDGPVPHQITALLLDADDSVIDALEQSPWLQAIAAPGLGYTRCIGQLLDLNDPPHMIDDPWA